MVLDESFVSLYYRDMTNKTRANIFHFLLVKIMRAPEFYENLEMHVAHDVVNDDKKDTIFLWIENIHFILKSHVIHYYCNVVGHDIVDEGYAGPDSGCIDLVCKRCGWGPGKVTLY